MYNQPYFIPNFYPNIAPNMIRGTLGRTALQTRGLGLFTKLGNSIKAINWGGLINNTSKTLGIINQTIPIAKQVGPIMNNIKSMVKIASVFKDETDTTPRKISPIIKNNPITKQKLKSSVSSNKEDYSPTFFIQ